MAPANRTYAFIAMPLLAACSQTPTGHLLSIDSEPAAAEVQVLGESVGVTPIQVPVSRVFPNVYPPDRQPLYGRVVLRKAGCRDHVETVSSEALAAGVRVKMDCGVVPKHVDSDVRARLTRLDDLRRDGIITAEEYAAQRQRILSEL